MNGSIIPGITPNFNWWEVKSRGDGALPTDDHIIMSNIQVLAVRLQRLRTTLGEPLHINSWYRSPEHNEAVGGAPDSLHTIGRAVDIHCHREHMMSLCRKAILNGFTGIGLYPYKAFIHIDDREPTAFNKKPLFWIENREGVVHYNDLFWYDMLNEIDKVWEEKR